MATNGPRWVDVLPLDLVERVAGLLLKTSSGASDLARFSKTCRKARAIVTSAFLRDHAVGHPSPERAPVTLEQLALLQELEAMGTNAVVFEGASTRIRQGSIGRLEEMAAVLKRHKRARAAVHAHTGVRAPSLIAPTFTRERALCVKACLVEAGVDSDRIVTYGWGNVVALAASWAPGRSSARAEVYFELDETMFPRLPPAYANLPLPQPADHHHSDTFTDTDESELGGG